MMIEGEVEELLQKLYVPSEAEVELLSQFAGAAYAHCVKAYPDRRSYVRRAYGPYSEADFMRPICLTGPAGVGKSALLQALSRVMPEARAIDLGSGHAPANVASSLCIQVRNKATLAEIMTPIFELGEAAGVPKRASDILSRAAAAAYKHGVWMLQLDEMQFLTQSARANTAVTNMLYHACYLGVPVVFVANYSLCRLLQKRPEQDTQRLLSRVHVLFPSPPHSGAWMRYLREVGRTLAATLDVNLVGMESELYEKTAGLKRLLIGLVAAAHAVAWSSGRRRVSEEDIEQAYESTLYASNRKQAYEMLAGPTLRAHAQYVCPFPVEAEGASAVADLRASMRSKELAELVQQDVLLPSKRKAAAAIKKISDQAKGGTAGAPQPLHSGTAEKTAVQARRAAKLSVDELIRTNSRRRGLYPPER
ncbi:AAA family ATPase [Achromobacter sp. NPDC058515]|uniref:AAA family ATPase n=1 Tax=Achromobacter sp. NPDC058515 TaxID=3346533 RepID=UPI003648158E